jgi:hypothetical protein
VSTILIKESPILTNSQSLGKPEQAVLDLTVLLESRDWKSIPGDAPLVAALMSVLSALLAKRQHVKEGVDYLEQEILGAILTLVEKIQNSEEIQKAHIGVEVIIKVIRGKSCRPGRGSTLTPSFYQPKNFSACFARCFRTCEVDPGCCPAQHHAHFHLHERQRSAARRRI